MPDPTNAPQSDWKSTRFWLAIGVMVLSITSVATLAILVIHYAADKEDAGTRVLGSVLPLLGTWVGTVLAYYFSKENFEAATKSVTDLAKQITPQEKLKSTPANLKMIPKAQMFSKSLAADKLKLNDLLSELESQKKGNRVPILGDKGEAQYILHRSIIDKFIVGLTRQGKSATEVAALTVQDLLNQDQGLRRMAQAFGVVRQDASLADAAEVMNKIDDCQDVFITQTGARDEAVLGWITNVILQENAKV
ncbi:MAG TPA: hypothetical protein VMH04_22485 [Candidatus Solibacter sp.]|nr:hypothetical protein [Candidatus Solibacter sp.]